MGIPWCFEPYVYTCKHCGGDVKRQYFNVETNELTQILSTKIVDGKSVRQYYTVFSCTECNEKIKSENDYYHE